MINYEGLHHVSLPVTDLEKAKAFYKDVLCLQEIKRPDFDFSGAWFQVGNQHIHLIVFPASEVLKKKHELNSKEAHFALRVTNYFEARDWLKKHNVTFTENQTSRSGFAQIFCADPDGHLIELHVEQKVLK
ncbi:VOC family protein [Salsuginibacillus kocurii]|uniref:VOC family protein n=1 Tax=Salsuginibacillus kocurii TaxID=427078 RepID=UPI0003714101|nr:VOC family protein [Salsuginibacillus kocurii]